MFFKRQKSGKDFKKMKAELSRKFPLCGADIHCGSVRGLISVVLPVYNCEKYLEESIRSVLAQTYTELELIIVDDGSTDESGRIADSFLQTDGRVRVIHQKNLHLPQALNNGFSAASGEFLTWTSADNRMLPCCLEVLAAELNRDRSCDMVYGNMRLIGEDGDLFKGFGWYELPPLSGNVILPDSTSALNTHANNTIGAAFLYRAGAALTLRGYSEYKYMLEDYDYFMRMNSLFTIKHSLYKKPVYEYRIHPDSLTAHDEELGITASRPKLMELDRTRREFYRKPVSFYSDGSNSALTSALFASGRRITNPETANSLAAQNPIRIFYINCGNIAPTWEPPEGVPRFLVMPEPCDGSFGYDVMLSESSVSAEGLHKWICPSGITAAAAFMSLRARNDILYHYEANL